MRGNEELSKTIEISFTPDSLAKAFKDINVFQTRKIKGVTKEINITANKVRNDAIQGIVGRRSKAEEKAKRKDKTAGDVSGPFGLKPHTFKGKLRPSVSIEKRATELDPVSFVKADSKYAAYVEFGDERFDTKARPHPFMVPALEMNRAGHVQRLGKELSKKI